MSIIRPIKPECLTVIISEEGRSLVRALKERFGSQARVLFAPDEGISQGRVEESKGKRTLHRTRQPVV